MDNGHRVFYGYNGSVMDISVSVLDISGSVLDIVGLLWI